MIVPLLTVKDVAKRLQVSTDKVRSLICSGRLKASNVGAGTTKQWRVTQADLDAFITANRNELPERPTARPPVKNHFPQFKETAR